VRSLELEERKSRGDAAAARLLDFKEKRIDDAISSILILNTIAHTAGAALAGNQAGAIYGDEFVAVFSAILIFLVLFFTEIIPKTLGTVYASQLVGFVGRAIGVLVWSLKPVLIITRMMTGFLARHEKQPVTRGELAAMVTMANREGALRDSDHRLVSNILSYDDIKVEDVMTPRTVLYALPVETTLGEFMADPNGRTFSRIPIFEKTRDHMVGYVLQRDLLAAVAEGEESSTPITDHAREAFSLPETISVAQALRRITEERQHMALAQDQFGGVSGLVTLEDLMETILGVEIVDELDRVADLRSEAIKLRDQRLASRKNPPKRNI
jgi:CBS domain containing-hemolysin-like protein